MFRKLVVALTVTLIGTALLSTDASARRGMGGAGVRGGSFHAGVRGGSFHAAGWRGGSFRAAGWRGAGWKVAGAEVVGAGDRLSPLVLA